MNDNYDKPRPWYLNISTYISVVGVILLLLFIFSLTKSEDSNALAVMDNLEFDWGDIPIQGGNVEHDFVIKNEGTDTLKVYPLVASCMCTNAQLVTSNDTGPLFTMAHDPKRNNFWRGEVKPGEEASIKVIFDPLYHGSDGIGPITRIVTVTTNDKTFELRLKGVVVSQLKQAKKNYTDITASELKSILDEKNLFLLDVHVPEQSHIKGTDAVIDYTKISSNLDKLPKDKSSKIVVYCRSGSMSKQVARELGTLGYTNVKNLKDGIIGWKDAGFTVK